jgi:hypothetical protein
MSEKREKFLRIYADVPLNLRSETIVTIDTEPISWNVAYLEIENNTSKSKEILKKLEELRII